jgi:hypothetical protein
MITRWQDQEELMMNCGTLVKTSYVASDRLASFVLGSPTIVLHLLLTFLCTHQHAWCFFVFVFVHSVLYIYAIHQRSMCLKMESLHLIDDNSICAVG